MKKIFLKSILVITPLLLSACSTNKNAIKVPTNYDLFALDLREEKNFTRLVKQVDEDTIISMSNSEGNFMLYVYSNYCSVCNTVKSDFRNYFAKYQDLIYAYDIDSSNYSKLVEYKKDIFLEEPTTPHLFVISKGKYVDEVNNTKLTTSKFFNSAVRAFIKSTDTVEVKTLDGLNKYLEDNNDPTIYLYDSKDESSYKKYIKNIEDNVKSLFIDINYAEIDLLTFAEANYQMI